MGVLGRRGRTALVVVALVASLVGCSAPSSVAPGTSRPGSTSQSTPGDTDLPDAATLAPTAATTKLATIRVDVLPAEAVTTLQLIRDGGPFPFPKDGVVFQNRERNLPEQPVGFYHEYTVRTPGAGDRGARRIVAGADGSRFWTTDHYDSFREVIASWS